ncbi:hypothetical protein JHS3_05560 [Jeongeupia sp. HS-3]|uniref:hypothetical protein n=1 Tax=Jeongeupia sp. HS-3 TaxID=1009682 RepID=UPI0018A55620|nr:hypothetical protein [Jeongeupia sp. HS-3]BCL74820.1 hypothetical protein JHS3_05560 [Jeongeupia sp. HS-3]
MNLNVFQVDIDRFVDEIKLLPDVNSEYVSIVVDLISRWETISRSAPYVCETQGEGFASNVSRRGSAANELKERLDWVAFFLACAWREQNMRTNTLASSKVEWLFSYFNDKNLELCDEVRARASYVNYLLPANVASNDIKKSLIELEEKKKSVSDHASKVSTVLSDADQRLTSWLKQVDVYESRLKEYRSNYNFLGLSHAFEGLIRSKKNELRIDVGILTIMAMVMTAIPIAYSIVKSVPDDLSKALLFYAPIVGVEILLVFFFRIVLRNYYSRKTQVVQLELRHGICAFYESYVDFTNKHKSDRSFDRFESLIFSGVVEESGKIPTTFDGLESIIASVANAMKGKS